MSYISDKILSLVKQLFPNGRAFWVPSGGKFEKFLKSFGGGGTNQIGTMERLVNDGRAVLDSVLPDNEKFTDGTVTPEDNDCDLWEGRLGIQQWGVTSASTPTRLQRMAAIGQKMAYPGSDAPRQAASYIQAELRAAGFDIYVYENLDNLSPEDIIGTPSGASSLGGFDLGESDLGEYWGGTVVANSVDETVDSAFAIPAPNFHGVLYFSGSPITTFANIPAIQKVQFRQLILNYKPANTVGILFVNYI